MILQFCCKVTNFIEFQENLSVKVIPTMPEKLNIPSGAMGPNDKDVLSQLSTSHPLQISEAKVRITTTTNCEISIKRRFLSF